MNGVDQATITSIATPPGYGGIGVIRLSGPDSLSLIRTLLHPASRDKISFLPNQSSFHVLIHPDTRLPIDEAVLTYFQSPHSFTGEDVVEISCHGSPVVLAEVVNLLRNVGARLAEPGEFSLRAFLNGRIDLSQAEGINYLIHSRTAYQARVAVRQVRGEISRQLDPVKQGLIDLIVHFESTVEFVEDDLHPLDISRIAIRLDELIEALERMASSYEIGRIIRSGIRLALIGIPNVGKSSLFNALLGIDRAIVTDLPGTTRDTLSESYSLRGVPLHIVDTAGIRETADLVEKIGVERTKSAIADADFIVAVIESGSSLPDDELSLFEEYPIDLFVINKCDLGPVASLERIREIAAGRPVVSISAKSGDGIESLRETIHHAILGRSHTRDESEIITNERHYEALELALGQIRQAKLDLQIGFTEEVALDNLHHALRSLGLITGETLIGDIINRIFATFCIGK